MTIRLPWPPKELSPNARVHFHAKAKAAKSYRSTAYWLSEIAGLSVPSEGEITVGLEFCPPDHRHRDLDNMLASVKPGLDGIADNLKVNDYRYTLTLRRGEPCKGGAVVVTVGA